MSSFHGYLGIQAKPLFEQDEQLSCAMARYLKQGRFVDHRQQGNFSADGEMILLLSHK